MQKACGLLQRTRFARTFADREVKILTRMSSEISISFLRVYGREICDALFVEIPLHIGGGSFYAFFFSRARSSQSLPSVKRETM